MSIRLSVVAAAIAAGCAALVPATAAAQTRLLRYPDIAGDRVAFCYAGDIWSALDPARQRSSLPGAKLDKSRASGLPNGAS